ncbi:hypothetical protein J3F83DRAFT_336383 [Trichoderma novae-zelandiae]
MGCGSSTPEEPLVPQRVLWIRHTALNKSEIYVHQDGQPADSVPLYSAQLHTYTKPSLRFFQGPIGGGPQVGEGNFHQMTSNTDLSLRGQSFKLNMSQLTYDFTLKGTPMGELKWKKNKFTGGSLELVDGNDRTLAKVKSNGVNILEKRLEIYIPCDDFFSDLIILSAIAARQVTDITTDHTAVVY